jgi:hypothetical protein
VSWVYGHAQGVDEDGRRRPELGLLGARLTRRLQRLRELLGA